MTAKDHILRGIITPQNYEDFDYTGYESYEKYLGWSNFQTKYPYNAKLLVKLFGERDGMEIFKHMIVLPESKARELIERLDSTVVKKSKLQNMSDC